MIKTAARILEAIPELTKEMGYPPTIREITERVGLKSPSTAKGHIDRLCKKGFIIFEPTKPRTIRVLKEWPQ